MSLSKAISYPEGLMITDRGTGISVRIRPPPPAILAICHELSSHGGQHAWVAEKLIENGFVHALDLRGRGRSGGQRLHVERVEDHVADLAVRDNTTKVQKHQNGRFRPRLHDESGHSYADSGRTADGIRRAWRGAE